MKKYSRSTATERRAALVAELLASARGGANVQLCYVVERCDALMCKVACDSVPWPVPPCPPDQGRP